MKKLKISKGSADESSDNDIEVPYMKPEDPNSSNSGDETDEDEGLNDQKSLWKQPDTPPKTMQEVSKKPKNGVMREELKMLDSPPVLDEDPNCWKGKLRQPKMRNLTM